MALTIPALIFSNASCVTGGLGEDVATKVGSISTPDLEKTSHAPASSTVGPAQSRVMSSPTKNICFLKSSSVVWPCAKLLLSMEKAATAIFTLATLLARHHFDKGLYVSDGVRASAVSVRAISGKAGSVVIEN